MTARIREFLKHRKDEGPCLVVDLDVVRENYLSFAKSLPDSKVFYAVKANPAPDILRLLVELGACFDVASVAETQAVLAAGAAPERISYGNTIKKESEIATAFGLGVTLYAVDCEGEVEKEHVTTAIVRGLPRRRVIVRHVLRNAAIPVVSIAAVQLGFMLGGSVVIEQVFALHGVGYLAWESISKNDYPVVQAVVLVLACIYVLLTLIADLLNAFLDPRLRTA